MLMSTDNGEVRHRFRRRLGATFKNVVRDALHLRLLSDDPAVALKKYGEIQPIAAEMATEIQQFVQEFYKVSQKAPALPAVTTTDGNVLEAIDRNLDEFSQRLADMMDVPGVGEIEQYPDRRCRFTYFEFEDRGGVFTRRFDLQRHTHELVRMRVRAIDATGVKMPERAQRMASKLRVLRPFARLVTGVLVAKGVEEAGVVTERTVAGQAVDSVSASAKQVAQTVGGGAAAAGKEVAGVVATAGAGLGSLLAVILSDPALIIGDKVLYGWEE